MPSAEAIALATEASPLRVGPALSIDGEQMVEKLRFALDRAGLRPRGTIVELGAGSRWLAGVLAREPDGIAFSEYTYAGGRPGA